MEYFSFNGINDTQNIVMYFHILKLLREKFKRNIVLYFKILEYKN